MVSHYSIDTAIAVSETEEELYSDEDDKQKKVKVFSLAYFSQLMNKKKIYSDDFDMSSEFKNQKRKKKFNHGSLMECPISEDVESEN
jgi:transposase